MPKRTNAFQKLIATIYRQMILPGGTVEESALLKERGSSTQREIDVLLKHRAFGIDLKIAVECRGRRHKDDIQWIDGLIGKYRDLGVDKVIAVSKSGFSKGASDKATASVIETLTLQKALETDWPAQFSRLGVAQLTRRDVPVSMTIATFPSSPLQLTASTIVYADNGTPIGTVDEMGQAIYRHRLEDINRTIKEKALSLFKTLEDLKTKHLVIEMGQAPTSPCHLRAEDGTRLVIQSITVQISCIFTVELANVSHYVLGSAQVSTATIGPSDHPFSLTAVQTSDKPNQATVTIIEARPPTDDGVPK